VPYHETVAHPAWQKGVCHAKTAFDIVFFRIKPDFL